MAEYLRAFEYVRVVCGSLGNLATAFAQLDEQALERTTPLSRNNRDSALLSRVRILVKNEAEDQSSDNKSGKIGAATTELLIVPKVLAVHLVINRYFGFNEKPIRFY